MIRPSQESTERRSAAETRVCLLSPLQDGSRFKGREIYSTHPTPGSPTGTRDGRLEHLAASSSLLMGRNRASRFSDRTPEI